LATYYTKTGDEVHLGGPNEWIASEAKKYGWTSAKPVATPTTTSPSSGYTPPTGASQVAATGLGGGSSKYTPVNNNNNNIPTNQPKPNAYYVPGDAESVQQLSSYYNLVPYAAGTKVSGKDIAVGGAGVIPDSALAEGTTRLGGADRYETAGKISTYVKGLAAVTPAQYQQMPAEQLQEAIQGTSDAIDATLTQVKDLINDVVNRPTSANVTPILSNYMNKMELFFSSYLTQAQTAYNEGMNDPGLLQAVTIIRDEAGMMKQQLEESINARGLSQSGIYLNETSKLNEATLQSEQAIVSTHLSEITQNLQGAMTNVLNQRVAALTQFAGVASQAEIQNATNHIQSLQAAISGLSAIAQVQQAGLNNLQDNFTSQLNTQSQNNQSNLNNLRDNATSVANAQRAYELGLQELGLDREKLSESKRQFDETTVIDWAKVNEMIRSNQASEAIGYMQAQASMLSASRSGGGGSSADDGLKGATFAVNHALEVGGAIESLKAQIDNGTLNAADVKKNINSYRQGLSAGSGYEQYTDQAREGALWTNFGTYLDSKIPAPASSGNWFSGWQGGGVNFNNYAPASGASPSTSYPNVGGGGFSSPVNFHTYTP